MNNHSYPTVAPIESYAIAEYNRVQSRSIVLKTFNSHRQQRAHC